MFEQILAEISNIRFYKIFTPSAVLMLYADRKEDETTDSGGGAVWYAVPSWRRLRIVESLCLVNC